MPAGLRHDRYLEQDGYRTHWLYEYFVPGRLLFLEATRVRRVCCALAHEKVNREHISYSTITQDGHLPKIARNIPNYS